MSRPFAALLVATAAALTTAVPAHAQLTVTHDERGDSVRDADLKKVTVDHSEKRVVLKSRMFKGSTHADEMWHLVDSVGDARPDFLVFAVETSEVTDKPGVGVLRVDGWPSRKDPYQLLHDGESVDCGLESGRRGEGHKLLVLTLGRGCFRTDGEMPARLRVSSFATYEWGKITDKVPAWRDYGKWVTAD